MDGRPRSLIRCLQPSHLCVTKLMLCCDNCAPRSIPVAVYTATISPTWRHVDLSRFAKAGQLRCENVQPTVLHFLLHLRTPPRRALCAPPCKKTANTVTALDIIALRHSSRSLLCETPGRLAAILAVFSRVFHTQRTEYSITHDLVLNNI